MSRNSSGTYTRPIVAGVVAGDDILASEYNSEIDDISTALTDSLSRSGKGAMLANLDAGGFKVTNLAAATANGQAVRYDEFTSAISSLTSSKANSGANTDITSLNAPALGAATATTQATTDDSTKVATTAFVQDIADLLCPVGTILEFSSNTVPSGFIEVPLVPTTKLRADYPRLHALYAADGYPWGNGDGSTTFGIPYLENDYTWLQAGGGAVGSVTAGEVISHSHTFQSQLLLAGVTGGAAALAQFTGASGTSSTGGTANKAAGRRVKFMVKY